jgi:hypothetical protein
MNHTPEFLVELKRRAGERCECERNECHGAAGRCGVKLSDEAGRSWSAVFTGESITFPPVTQNYIALCAACAVPRTRKP